MLFKSVAQKNPNTFSLETLPINKPFLWEIFFLWSFKVVLWIFEWILLTKRSRSFVKNRQSIRLTRWSIFCSGFYSNFEMMLRHSKFTSGRSVLTPSAAAFSFKKVPRELRLEKPWKSVNLLMFEDVLIRRTQNRRQILSVFLVSRKCSQFF